MVAPTVSLGRHQVCWFHVWGIGGLAAAVVVGLAAAHVDGVPVSWVMVLTIAGVATFLILARLTRAIVGEERLTYYHHSLAITAVTVLVAALAHRPILATLDIATLGVGAFLACGRIGCLFVGCCIGRPARHGIVYGSLHVAAGLDEAHAGMPRVPVQAIESSLVALAVALGLGVGTSGDPGEGFVVFVATYAAIRLGTEQLRGDRRPYFQGLSEAQWTSATLCVLLLGGAAAGLFPARVDAALLATYVVAAAVQLSIAHRKAAMRSTTPAPHAGAPHLAGEVR